MTFHGWQYDTVEVPIYFMNEIFFIIKDRDSILKTYEHFPYVKVG